MNDDFSTKTLSPLSKLRSNQVEYIYTNDNPATKPSAGFFPSRSWSDDMMYGSGALYMGGLASGTLWGIIQGSGSQPTMKLRVNSILNAVSRRAPMMSNSMGMLGLIYNMINSAAYSQIQNEVPVSLASGFLTGFIFRSTKGLRTATMAGVMTTCAVGAWQGFKNIKKDL